MTKEEMREEIKKGYRDKRGARRQKSMKHQFKGGENIEDMTGNELLATIELARRNMKGNMGRARFFTAEELRQEIIKYWNYIEEQNLKGNALIPDVEGLATFLGVTRETL